MTLRQACCSLLLLLAPARVSAQGAPSRWDHSTGEGWREGCATLTLVRDLDGGIATHLENGARCPVTIALDSFYQIEGRSFGQDRFLVRFHYVVSEPTYAPAWVVGDASVSFLEGRRNRIASFEDETYIEPIRRCDPLSCAIPARLAGLAAPAAGPKIRGWMGATRGDTALTPWVLPADSASPPLEFRLSLGWRPDSIVLGLGVKVVAARRPQAGEARDAAERAEIRTPGLRGGIREDVLALSGDSLEGATSLPLVWSLCGGRLVEPPSWMVGGAPVGVVQSGVGAAGGATRSCYGQYRGWEVRNLWHPDPGQRLIARERLDAASGYSIFQADRTPVRGVAVEGDLPLSEIQVIAGALGTDSVLRDTTVGWFVFFLPGSTTAQEGEVDTRLSQIARGGAFHWLGEVVDFGGRPRELPRLPPRKWMVADVTRRFLRTHLHAPVRAVEETLLTRHPDLAWIRVQFGDTLRRVDLSEQYGSVVAFRIGERIGWQAARGPWLAAAGEVLPGRFPVRWPDDTLVLRALQLARGALPSSPLDEAISELRSAIIRSPEVSREWLVGEIRESYPYAGPDSLDAVACRRARAGPDWGLLLLLGRRGGTASLCAIAILKELRGRVVLDPATPREALIFYTMYDQGSSFQDTLAAIAWDRHDWAVFGAAHPRTRAYPVIERLIHEFHLPPEVAVQDCIGPSLEQLPNGCNGLVDHAIRLHQTPLLQFLANRGLGSGRRVEWIKVMRYLRGDLLRAQWICYLPCDSAPASLRDSSGPDRS